MRALVHQAARYVTVGGLATATHVALAIALNSLLAWPALAANTVAFAAAFTVSYFGNWRWTFASAGGHAHLVPRFLLVTLLGFALNQTSVYSLHGVLQLPFWMALVPAVAVIPVLTFWLNRTRVFLERH